MNGRRGNDIPGVRGYISRFFGRDIIKVVLALVVGFFCAFILKTFIILPLPGDYVTKTDFSQLTDSLKIMDSSKVSISQYKQDCDYMQKELDRKAEKISVEAVEKNVERILTVMLDPSKASQVREEVRMEKRRN
jgi:hypothetical protein